jgi:hypothetical protein
MIGLIIALLAGLATVLSRQFVEHKLRSFSAEDQLRYKTPLYDWIRELFPNAELRHYRWIPDDLTTSFLILQLVHLWMFCSYGDINFFLADVGSVYIVRAVCCAVNISPRCRTVEEDPTQELATYANPRFPSWCNRLRQAWFQAQNGHGHDLIISGHASMTVSILCDWTRHQILPFYACVMCWSVGFVMSVLCVITRCHDSRDMILAWCIGIGMYVGLMKVYI